MTYIANVKAGEIISLVPVTTVRYYVKKKEDAEKLKQLEADGIEVAKFEVISDGWQKEIK